MTLVMQTNKEDPRVGGSVAPEKRTFLATSSRITSPLVDERCRLRADESRSLRPHPKPGNGQVRSTLSFAREDLAHCARFPETLTTKPVWPFPPDMI